MTQNERMRIFKKAWKEAILSSLYSKYPSGNPIGCMAFLKSLCEQLFPDNNLLFKMDIENLEKMPHDMRTMHHDAQFLFGNDIINFTSNDLRECDPGSHFMYVRGENSRLLKKTGTKFNTGMHLGNGYYIENAMGSSNLWDDYKHDNEFTPRLLVWYRFNYNPTLHVNNEYFRPNNIGDNNDEVVWKDFWNWDGV